MFWIALPLMFLSRWNWEEHPGLPACALFWAGFFFLYLPLVIKGTKSRFRRICWGVSGIGMASNAIATLANGGHMPAVVSYPIPSGVLWVPLTAASKFPALCDIYPGVWFYDAVSIGDYVLYGSLIVAAISGLFSERRRV